MARLAITTLLLALAVAAPAGAQVELPAVPAPAPEPRSEPRLDRGLLAATRRAIRRLPGRRHAELGAVKGMVDALGDDGRLSRSRTRLAAETLRFNVRAWRLQRLPRPGERRVSGGLVYEYRSGRGFHVHPLGSFGRVNALAKPCVVAAERLRRARVARARARVLVRRVGESFVMRTRRPRLPRCRAGALRRSADALVEVSVKRGGFVAWEYLFPFGGRQWPWISAMTQGTAVQALARAADALDEPRYAAVAERALGAFDTPPPAGVRVGDRYAMYSQAPSLDVLNGFLQSLIGLYDHARLTGSQRSAELFRRAERSAPAAVRAADTGAWSLYARGGREASLHYHRLVTHFLGGLCERTDRDVYCSAQRRFAFYAREAPSLSAVWPAAPRARSMSTITVSLSKISTVVLRAPGVRRRVVLPRGRHMITWTPTREYRSARVRVSATGPEGRTARVSRILRIRPSYATLAARRRAFLRSHRRAARAHQRAVRRAR